jgi:hypothetical protein
LSGNSSIQEKNHTVHVSSARPVPFLLPVADEITKALMVYFYLILKEVKTTSKIEALRQVQFQLAGSEDKNMTTK